MRANYIIVTCAIITSICIIIICNTTCACAQENNLTENDSTKNNLITVRPEQVGKCSGFLYKAKKDGVSVFDEPSTSGAVIAVLSSGETVCYVGEKEGFAMIHWQVIEDTKNSIEEPSKAISYVRLVDLWTSKNTQSDLRGFTPKSTSQDLLSWIYSYYSYIRSGGVPEDGLLPYRSFMNLFDTESSAQQQDHSRKNNLNGNKKQE